MSEIVDGDLIGLKQLVEAGETGPAEIVQAMIDRSEAVEPVVNGFVQTGFEAALDKARSAEANPAGGGRLAGLPFAVKDCLEVEGWITSFGTRGYANHVSNYSATAVKRLEAEGAILLGLTSTPELGTSIETDSLLYGRTNNPIDPERTPGGSTGGGAALVKAKAIPYVIGSDFGGGSRNTAQCCGLFAHRPSLGRVSTAGYLLGCSGMKGQMCRVAPLARSVRDLELVFQVISGADPGDPKTDGIAARAAPIRGASPRVALIAGCPTSPLDPGVAAAIATFGEALQVTCRVETPDLSGLFDEGGEIAFGLFSADGGRLLRHVLETVTRTREVSRSMASWLDSVGRLGERPAGTFIELMSRWEGFRLKVNRLFESYDLLVCPAGPTVAPRHGDTLVDDALWRAIAYTTPLSLTASPVLVVPVGLGEHGLPVTVQIAAASWADEELLAFGRRLQEGEGPARDLIARALAVPCRV
jgi:Asp-tRNA(Asn)/Glu-tRNA(Gln) amidotransferase A subunit family amidase